MNNKIHNHPKWERRLNMQDHVIIDKNIFESLFNEDHKDISATVDKYLIKQLNEEIAKLKEEKKNGDINLDSWINDCGKLKEELITVKGQCEDLTDTCMEYHCQEIRVKEELALKDKALELACKKRFIVDKNKNVVADEVAYFIEQARKK